MRFSTRIAVMVAAVLLLTSSVNSQSVITLDWSNTMITTSTMLTDAPYAHWFTQTRHQYLITPQDFALVGLIPSGPVEFTSLAFYVEGFNGSPYELNEFTVKMKNTTATSLSMFDNVGLQQMYGPVNQIRANITVPGWLTHTFTSPFVWDGASNILIDVCHQNTNGNYGYTWAVRYANVPAPSGRQVYAYDDYSYGIMCVNPNYTYTKAGTVPHMQFGCGGTSSITAFQAPSLYQVPNIIPVNYTIGHATESFLGKITFNLKTPTGQLVRSETLNNINVVGGSTINSVYNFNAMSVTPGWYIMELDFEVLNSCKFIDHVFMKQAVLLLAPGTTVCEVWPGDTDNNGLVNYNDRAALNKYIYDANMRSSWLQGPQRFRTDIETNPLAYLTWEMQPGAPWQTPDGCFKDTDGNGVINNFDYIAIKVNWLKSSFIVPSKDSKGATALSFGLDQNYPNPFNPSTTLNYSAPERSTVRLVVTDMLGREVMRLVDGVVEAGMHSATFDGSALNSGHYIATATMTGIESGLTFSHTVKMTLSK